MHGTAIIIVHAGWLAGVVDAWYSNHHRACWLAGWCSGCMVQQSSSCMLDGWLV